ncbi:MAG: hypothetical protein AAF806_17160 [Bacteroidota bacterium]
MERESLITKSIFPPVRNEVFTQYLISGKNSPLETKSIFGCWLLIFHQEELLTAWELVYNTFKEFVNSNTKLCNTVSFEDIYKLDNLTLCLNRGFNEAYTTSSYAEFLTDGDCKPNDWIIEHIEELKNALNATYNFQINSIRRKNVIDAIIHKSFVEPNSELKWTDEPFPWTLYIPPISLEEIINFKG